MPATTPTRPQKTRKPRRAKADIETAINQAAERLIVKQGFSETLVTDIMREAEIEPVVFYNRYKNIEDFYAEFVKRYDYWFGDVVEKSLKNKDLMDALYDMLDALLTNLSKNSVMLELLRWEIATSNDITNACAQLRESHTLPLAGKYMGHYYGAPADVVGWATLLISGIYYLCVHKERSEFCGMDINNPAHLERIRKAIREIVDQLRSVVETKTEKQRIAEKLRRYGVSEEIIKKSIGG